MTACTLLPMLSRLLVTGACLLFVGCEATGVYRGVPPSSPHAVLAAENPPGMRGFLGQGRKVSPRFINGKPAAFWRGSDRFLIAPGPTSLDLIDVAEPYSYQPVRFTARAGARYVVRPSVTAGQD
ncbi:MAG: hypothetical protein EOP85_22050, partial [Verrucomicrobiaceae bacterium]